MNKRSLLAASAASLALTATTTRAQTPFPVGGFVALRGTPHLWFAGADGKIHWGGDTRALSDRHILWSHRREVDYYELLSLPIGDPWLSAGLLKDGDPIYLVKWETDWELPKLLHIQSIKDVEAFGINGSNYGHFVLDKEQWQNKYQLSADALERDILPRVKPTWEQIKAESRTVDWRHLFRNHNLYHGQRLYYRGEIEQVIERDNGFDFRIDVEHDNYSSEIVYLIGYSGRRFIDGDIVEFVGIATGLHTYNSIWNQRITIPEIKVLEMRLIDGG